MHDEIAGYHLFASCEKNPTCTARWTGDAPLYLGSRLGWMFRVPKRGMSRNFCGSMLPYAAVMHRSGCRPDSCLRNSSCEFTYDRRLKQQDVQSFLWQHVAICSCDAQARLQA